MIQALAHSFRYILKTFKIESSKVAKQTRELRERSHMTSARFWQILPPPVSIDN